MAQRPQARTPVWEYWQSPNSQWTWALRSANRRIIASGWGFNSDASVRMAIGTVERTLGAQYHWPRKRLLAPPVR